LWIASAWRRRFASQPAAPLHAEREAGAEERDLERAERGREPEHRCDALRAVAGAQQCRVLRMGPRLGQRLRLEHREPEQGGHGQRQAEEQRGKAQRTRRRYESQRPSGEPNSSFANFFMPSRFFAVYG